MSHASLFRRFAVAAAVLVGLALAAPAYAQLGSIKGRVLGPDGKPIQGAKVTIEYTSDPTMQPKALDTDQRGEFNFTNLRPGQWKVEARSAKGDMIAAPAGPVAVQANNVNVMEDLKLRPVTDSEKTVSAEERAKMEEEIKKNKATIDAANAAMASGNYDEALTKINEVIAKVPKCGSCYVNLGQIQVKKGDDKGAEEHFLKAIELGPEKDMAGAYSGLATIYNKQKKLDEAAKMSTKANELLEAGGGGNASTAYNQGVILWNKEDAAAAEVQFRKAVTLDPKMADAHFYLGLVLLNQGKMKDAKPEFDEYLKLDPKGKNAADAKGYLAIIK